MQGDSLENESGPSKGPKQEAPAPQGAQAGAKGEGAAKAREERKPSILDLINESSHPEAIKIKADIEEVRGKRRALIDQIKAFKRRLNYKNAESETIERFLAMNPQGDFEEKMRKVRMLKRQKERLEFRISTEASSLSDEKALIRKIKEISAELDEYMKTVRLVRKRDLVKKDIEEFTAKVAELNGGIGELDKQLDVLYDSLRRLLKVERIQEHRKRPERKTQPQPMPEVNLEDIAVIKKRK